MSAQPRGEETRRQILAAALTCFSQSGFDKTGVAAICQQAGITKGAFYHHFPSKQAVFIELLTAWLDRLDRQLTSQTSSADTIPDRLRFMAAAFGQVFQDAQNQLPMFLEFWSKAARDPDIWEATIAPYHRYQAFFADLAREGIQAGDLRDVPPDTIGRIFVSVAVGVLLQALLVPEEEDWGLVAREGVDLLLQGLER